MFDFLKSKKSETEPSQQKENPKQSWLSRLSAGLKRTRHVLTDNLATLVLGKKQIDADLLKELETQLLLADLGVELTDQILKKLTEQVARKELNDPQRLIDALKNQLESL